MQQYAKFHIAPPLVRDCL